ncbi:MAG: efflux RND transporter permease subunit [Bacteroidia bacterium]
MSARPVTKPWHYAIFVRSEIIIKNQKKYNQLILCLVIGFSVLCGFKIGSLDFNYDFEAFFPNEDNELELYTGFRSHFEYDNEFVLVALENKAGIFNKEFLNKVDHLSRDLAKIPHVRKVISPTNIKNMSIGGIVPVQSRVLHIEDPDLYRDDSIAIYRSGELVGSFFPADAKSVSVFVKTDDELSKRKCDTLADRITAAIKRYQFDEIHFVGRIFAQRIYLENVKKEFVYFLGLSFIVVVIFLWLSFRSFYGIVVPICIVLLSIFWTLGIMALLHQPIDIMTMMLPTMVFIAGMSDVVHFFSKYFEELAKGTEKHRIYPLILKEVGFPTFLTLITTVVGFLSLLFSSIQPIRDFGIYTSVGVTIAFILSYTLLPAILFFFTPKKLVLVHSHDNRTHNAMRKGLFWIFRNQKTILVITAVTLLLSVVGIFKIRINNILLEDLSNKVKIKQDFNFFDKNYSGARPFELQITIKNNKSIWDYDIIEQLNGIDDFVRKEYGAGFLYSPSALVKSIYKASVNDSAALAFPGKQDYAEIQKALLGNRKNKEIKRIVSPDLKTARLSSKIKDMGSMAIAVHNARFKEYLARHVNPADIDVAITGAAHLIDRNNEYMVSNMTQGFLFSIVVIALLTYLLHRSWRMVLVFILPNVIPLLIIAGIMGFAGIELKAATSLVFSIAFGVATDDTIHFISRLKIELGYGKSLMYAFKRTYFETGKPILLTTFILMGGFFSLMISDFQSTFYFGFLICITIIIAVIADIFLLPVLLFMILGKKKKKD